MKRLNSIILLTLLMSMIGTKAYSHDIEVVNAQGKTIYYVWTNNHTELAVSYQGTYLHSYINEYSGEVIIPASVNYNGGTYSVTSIGEYTFCQCSGLTSVTIPNSVTSIGNYAFRECTGLTSVTIPNSVTSIGEYTFNRCSGLTSVTIPNSVTSIGYNAFSSCSGLTSITVSSGNPKYDSRNNCNAIIETSSNTLITGCKNTVIPNSVTSIGGAFSGCSGLTSITIPNSVTSIGDWTFNRCSGLTSVTIPNSVTSIGDWAFCDCSALTSIEIPNSVTSIGNYAFSECTGLTSVTIPNSVTSIGEYTFYQCSGLTSVTIPNSVTSIGNYAFYNCKGLTSVTIPNSVTSIGNYAFYYCNGLESVSIGSGIQSIGIWAFASCTKLADFYCYAENVPTTESDAFNNSNIGNATLHVPDASVTNYAQTAPWSGFKSVVAAPTKCATPTIIYNNGEVSFECETEGVTFVYSFTPPAAGNNEGAKVVLPTTYTVTVYAKKEGYMNSDVATQEIDIRGLKGDADGNGVVDIADAVHIVNFIVGKTNSLAPRFDSNQTNPE